MRLLLEMFPEPDEEIMRLVAATDQALLALRGMGCGEHLIMPKSLLTPPTPPASRRPPPAVMRAYVGIGTVVLLIVAALAWPSFLAGQEARRHEVAARESAVVMKELLVCLRHGMTYRQYVDFLGTRVTPAAMNLRVTAYASGTRQRTSFNALDSAYQAFDETNRTWRQRQAELGLGHVVLTLGSAGDDPVLATIQARWEQAEIAIKKGEQALERGD